MWTDGSISAIATGGVNVSELKSFYTGEPNVAINKPMAFEDIHTGSNGFAVAPSKTASGKAMLYINPHVSFYFRPEVHMVSEQGLNAYGAVTWGQFFVYQGFNEHCGWMHTSGYADVADLYNEQVVKQGDAFFYKYDGKLLPVKSQTVTIGYKEGGSVNTQKVVTYATHHGPVMAKRNGQWISVRAVNRNMDGLIQSWQRTKCTSFAAFKKNMELLANASNNTVYADAEGNIAYWHGNFIPRRDTTYDWNKPVDGSIKATEWNGLHPLDETIHLYNPASGWIQNCNSTPFTASGSSSPRKQDYPAYMSTEPENFRGLNAVRVLGTETAFTQDKLIAAGYDTYLTAFEELVPAVIKAYSTLATTDSLYNILVEPIATLAKWDFRSSVHSIATTLAVEWGQRIQPAINRAEAPDFVAKLSVFAKTASAVALLQPLAATVRDLNARYGTWLTPWGEINRYQRLTGQLQETYDDNKPSIPSGMTASTWGCLPSFVSRPMAGTKKRYGYNGNSFICAIEFGEKVKAKSLLAGGNSSDPSSAHFGDQAEMYTKGQFKEVLYYKEDVMKHVEQSYHPGETKH
jgi:acyl-homoserine lactone acylase PvdQ